jgi:hypothetical protein
MSEEEILEYLAKAFDEEVEVLPMEFGLNTVEQLTNDLIKQIEASKQ